MIAFHSCKSVTIAEFLPGSVKIASADDILQLMADAAYEHSVQCLIIHAVDLPKDFFELRSGVAGEILQKFSNYRMKLAIIGDFSAIKSNSLRDFIRESNNRRIISFVASLSEALSVLDR